MRVVEERLGGIPESLDPVPVALARADPGNMRVPGALLRAVHADAALGDDGAGVVDLDEAQVHRCGTGCHDHEVRPIALGGGAQTGALERARWC